MIISALILKRCKDLIYDMFTIFYEPHQVLTFICFFILEVWKLNYLIILCQGNIGNILLRDIKDQNNKFVYATQGHYVVYFNVNLR